MGRRRGNNGPPPKSPLYTSKGVVQVKHDIIAKQGKDSDGAFRAFNRKDKPKEDNSAPRAD